MDTRRNAFNDTNPGLSVDLESCASYIPCSEGGIPSLHTRVQPPLKMNSKNNASSFSMGPLTTIHESELHLQHPAFLDMNMNAMHQTLGTDLAMSNTDDLNMSSVPFNTQHPPFHQSDLGEFPFPNFSPHMDPSSLPDPSFDAGSYLYSSNSSVPFASPTSPFPTSQPYQDYSSLLDFNTLSHQISAGSSFQDPLPTPASVENDSKQVDFSWLNEAVANRGQKSKLVVEGVSYNVVQEILQVIAISNCRVRTTNLQTPGGKIK